HLLHARAPAQRHQRFRVSYRNRIFELQPTQLRPPRFDGEDGRTVVLDAHADRGVAVRRQVRLPDVRALRHELLPVLARDQEFALDLDAHVRLPTLARAAYARAWAAQAPRRQTACRVAISPFALLG